MEYYVLCTHAHGTLESVQYMFEKDIPIFQVTPSLNLLSPIIHNRARTYHKEAAFTQLLQKHG